MMRLRVLLHKSLLTSVSHRVHYLILDDIVMLPCVFSNLVRHFYDVTAIRIDCVSVIFVDFDHSYMSARLVFNAILK